MPPIQTHLKYVVTHSGSSHRDELLAIAVLLAQVGQPVPVYRRTPVPGELADPSIAVIDCGGLHDPQSMNFDHHQYQGGDCSFLLVMKYLGDHDHTEDIYPWYRTTNDFDVFGPVATLKKMGVSMDASLALRSPMEDGLKRIFGQMEEVEPWLLELLMRIGRGILDSAGIHARRLQLLQETAAILTVRGVTGIFSTIETDPALAIRSFKARNCPDAAFSICPDHRGPGHILYRFDDDERIDFSKLSNNQLISFAHAGGFVAKTAQRMTSAELVELAGICLVKQK